jgi:hypothetical protein
MFLISCKLCEHGSHTDVRDDVYILYSVIVMEKFVSFEIHVRKFCMDIGHSHTHNLFENAFIWVAQIPGSVVPSWLGHEQLYFFDKSRNQEQKRHTYPFSSTI